MASLQTSCSTLATAFSVSLEVLQHNPSASTIRRRWPLGPPAAFGLVAHGPAGLGPHTPTLSGQNCDRTGQYFDWSSIVLPCTACISDIFILVLIVMRDDAAEDDSTLAASSSRRILQADPGGTGGKKYKCKLLGTNIDPPWYKS